MYSGLVYKAINLSNSYVFNTSSINTIQPYSQFVMGHYYSLESSKIDLLFVGGLVRSETDLIVLDFFCELCNHSH